MPDAVSLMNLADDLRGVLECDDARRWTIEGKVDSLEVLASMSPQSAPSESFQVRLLWVKYPGDAPSLKFRDPTSGRLDVTSAWPNFPGARPGSFDTCLNYSAEGFGLHPEWRTDPANRWDPKGNALLRVLRTLQDQLDFYYGGRAA